MKTDVRCCGCGSTCVVVVLAWKGPVCFLCAFWFTNGQVVMVRD